MKTLIDIYKIGRGPSSSHTMAVKAMVLDFLSKHPDAQSYIARAGGSLALTGAGHKTDWIMRQVFAEKGKKAEVILDEQFSCDSGHPCPLTITANYSDKPKCEIVYYSIGGGDIAIKGDNVAGYQFRYKSFAHLAPDLDKHLNSPQELVSPQELEHIKQVWKVMQNSISVGLTKSGVLDGGLNYMRQAKTRLEKKDYLAAFAYAVVEENASAETDIVTAPTCGACGILPSVLYAQRKFDDITDDRIHDALIVGGMIAGIVKMIMPTSGAACGCQAEVGVACAMAAAALAWLKGGSIDDIEVAASIALEDCLGMTCDPVLGLVQLPCIDRNAIRANAINFYVNHALLNKTVNRRTFDIVLATMERTGRDMHENYRETSKGGLAEAYEKNKNEFFIDKPCL